MPIGTDKDGNLIAGFYAFHSHRIVPCEKCLLQPDIFSKITADFLNIATELKLSAYDETTRKGTLRHLYLRKGHYSGEICLCIVVAKIVPEIKILSDRLLEKYPEIVTVYTIGDVSKELCGGPHVQNTKELGRFKIKKEESSSSGVRRIKAILIKD